MNKSFGKYVLIISSLIAAFVFGSFFSTLSVKHSLSETQAKINFGHLQAYTDLQSEISANCTATALARLEMMINQQRMLIAGHFQRYDDVVFEEYVRKSNSGLVVELKSIEIDFGNNWTLPRCDKLSG